jgi:protein-tyrosine-phosphatase
MSEKRLYPALQQYAGCFMVKFDQIPDNRKKDLDKVVDYIKDHLAGNTPAKLTFICTHNSRRSHMGQIWAQAAADYFGIEGIRTFSGGTEATAFNPNAVKAMVDAGFKIKSDGNPANPVYKVSFAEDQEPMQVFSKKYNDKVNPQEDFCAIMTCSDADENCPFIPGATLRIPITYEDPKAYDNTPDEAKAYAERCYQIGSEMFYIFNKVKF